jgi:homoserine O-acetyltransferase
MVHLQRCLLDHLGIARLRFAIGASLGGMQVLEWLAGFPERVQSAALVGVSGRRSAWGIAISEAQRQAIYADPDWHDGRYPLARPPRRGLAVARMMAMVTYRSWENFEQRFARNRQPDDPELFCAESYLRHQGGKLPQRFDANSYVRLSQAMDSHDVARGRGSYFEVLQSLETPTLIVSVDSDVLYPPWEQRELAEQMPNARYEVLHTPAGHDGFLIEVETLDAMAVDFLRQEEAARR